jgi:hypothetical protein
VSGGRQPLEKEPAAGARKVVSTSDLDQGRADRRSRGERWTVRLVVVPLLTGVVGEPDNGPIETRSFNSD